MGSTDGREQRVDDEGSDGSEQENVLTPPLVRSDPADPARRTWTGSPVPAGYPEMIDELRELLDRVATTAPSAEVVADTTKAVAQLNAWLAEYEVDEADRFAGRLLAAPGRAQLTGPPLLVDEIDDGRMTGRVRFGAHFLGSNGVVHGGAIPLLFDDVLGRLALTGGRSRSRTAFMHVDYRAVAPIDTELRVEAWFEREEGRKRFVQGTLSHGDTVCSEVSALFVALKPGQR
ncbi:PaaI family thioesterase [Actinomycetospora sp. TBRC 11914]|uniref:PaaI family thioesterase n=1 Tax=Actinomycetospora sp. TBRC 11914 TaxID=2729387 RepID=UPI00145EEBCD|nr:PaaI family thioesterase [Actinomycetospora sp. TBRC 11914]NMO91514.1 PaaI family thioesterase [Actinomycetospora sp. TBRC 11914]